MQLFQLAAVLLFWETVSGSPLTFCGPEPCLIPINSIISCQELIMNYEFFGSCCRLVDIPATGGCRVDVGGGGNCAWLPFCGSCDHTGDSFCGREYRTDTEAACPDFDYDALAIQSAWDDYPTCMPSAAPAFDLTESSTGASITILFAAVAAGTLCATLF